LGHGSIYKSKYRTLKTKASEIIINHGVHQIIEAPVRKHSKKPDEVREKIIDLVGDISKIELFAREKVDGWDSWGNEIDGKNITEKFNKLA
jgi:N6-adenosine-specific RNA methylase IME4